jgi:hypothetical protein
MKRNDAKSRADAMFRKPAEPVLPADADEPPRGVHGVYARLNPPPHKVAAAVDEYKARQEAERAKMARLKVLRLAAEAGVRAKAEKTKDAPAGGKAKR